MWCAHEWSLLAAYDLTPCFQATVLWPLPSLIFFLVGVVSIPRLYHERYSEEAEPLTGDMRGAVFIYVVSGVLALAALLQIILPSIRPTGMGPLSGSGLVYHLLQFLAWMLAIARVKLEGRIAYLLKVKLLSHSSPSTFC
jgi:hypothetical protein